jgi:hypothetical protein
MDHRTDVEALRNNTEQRAYINEWCRRVFDRELPVTNCKDYHMWCMFDDRAFNVTPNRGLIMGEYPEELRP